MRGIEASAEMALYDVADQVDERIIPSEDYCSVIENDTSFILCCKKNSLVFLALASLHATIVFIDHKCDWYSSTRFHSICTGGILQIIMESDHTRENLKTMHSFIYKVFFFFFKNTVVICNKL